MNKAQMTPRISRLVADAIRHATATMPDSEDEQTLALLADRIDAGEAIILHAPLPAPRNVSVARYASRLEG